jgi:hypothetical protein
MNILTEIFKKAALTNFGADSLAKVRTNVFVGCFMQFLLDKTCFTFFTPLGLSASSISSSLHSWRSLQRCVCVLDFYVAR